MRVFSQKTLRFLSCQCPVSERNRKRIIISFGFIVVGWKIKKGLKSRPSILNHGKCFRKKYCLWLLNWPRAMTKWFTIQKTYSKLCSTLCAHEHGVTVFKINVMVQNIKNVISQILRWNKKIIKFYLKE